MSKVSGGLRAPPRSGKPGGSPSPQITVQLQQLGEPGDSFSEAPDILLWEPQIWGAWPPASTPASGSLTSPAHLRGAHTSLRPRRSESSKQAARTGPRVPTQSCPGAHLTSTAGFKDTAASSPGPGSRPAPGHTPTPTRPGRIPVRSPQSRQVGCSSERRARKDGGGGRARMRDARRRAGAAHLFDLVILQLGEVIGQELRGDHAGGRGRRAAGVRPVGPPQPGRAVVLRRRPSDSSSSPRGSSSSRAPAPRSRARA